MNLRHLTDSTLLKDTLLLAKHEREISTKLLHHLKEIDRRKLFSDLRCSSLYDYCTRILGFSNGSAYRRIQAARLLAELPEIQTKIENGGLNLCNIASASSFFNSENIKTKEDKLKILSQVENLTSKECEQKLFALTGKKVSAKELSRRISSENISITMTLSDETHQKLREVRNLFHKELSNNELISKIVDIAILHLQKKKFKLLS